MPDALRSVSFARLQRRWPRTSRRLRARSSAGATVRLFRRLEGRALGVNEDSLGRWLADPEKFAHGQRMGVNVSDANDRSDLIAFLKAATKTAK